MFEHPDNKVAAVLRDIQKAQDVEHEHKHRLSVIKHEIEWLESHLANLRQELADLLD